MTPEHGLFENLSKSIRNSITIKLITITLLMLLLLIPESMINSIINEREQNNLFVTAEVTSKWANAQEINGPILSIPITYEYEQNDKTIEAKKYWQLLPENLKLDGNVFPEQLKRSIYEVIVYKSSLNLEGSFNIEATPEIQNLKEIHYDEAFLTVGISDLRGIKNQISLDWNNEILQVKPGSKIPEIIFSGITVNIPDLTQKTNEIFNFNFNLDLQGSKNLSFIPIADVTDIKLSSTWHSPSFNGNFLPDTREISEDGFTASWSVLQLNRNFPKSWIGNGHKQQMKASSFGVDLILPMDDYQKAYRSSKYAVMTISLTFLIFFLVEILNKRKIHPFQYALVGLALCLFYILLVSISEHADFNLAFGISTIAIVSMISMYSISVFKKIKLSLILGTILICIYGFLFITLQLADYALLMGSIGLASILGLTMYFTRNINWYGLTMEN